MKPYGNTKKSRCSIHGMKCIVGHEIKDDINKKRERQLAKKEKQFWDEVESYMLENAEDYI